jgi:AcrR family transcriptional regulator
VDLVDELPDQGRVPDDTRSGICDAVLDLVLEKGFRDTTLEIVLAGASCSKEEFKRNFADLEDCTAQMFADYAEDCTRSVEAAYAGHDSWRDALRAAAYAALRWQREHPRELRFGAFEMLWAGDMARVQIDNGYSRFTDLVDAGRQELDDPDSVPRSTAEGIIGSIAMVLTKWLKEGGSTEGAEKFPCTYIQQVMYMAVLPYLGQEAAEEELEIPPPPDLNSDPSTSP